MKKLLLFLTIAASILSTVNAQILPKFQFGIKGGLNFTDLKDLSSLPVTTISPRLYNRAGYVGGVWARIGAAGIYFQPEAYLTSKSVGYYDDTFLISASVAAGGGNSTFDKYANRTTLTSIDVPLLLGTKFGILNTGIRINTGPVISFAVNNKQTIKDSFQQAVALRFKDQNYGWQFGAGVDVLRFSLDARYEAGISQVENDYGDKRHINLFNFTLGYRIF